MTASARPPTTPVSKVARQLEGQAAVYALQQLLSLDNKSSLEKKEDLASQMFDLLIHRSALIREKNTVPLIVEEMSKRRLAEKPIAELNGCECLMLGMYYLFIDSPNAKGYLLAAEQKGEMQAILFQQHVGIDVKECVAKAEKIVEQSRSIVLADFLLTYYRHSSKPDEEQKYMELAVSFGSGHAMGAMWTQNKSRRDLLELAAIKGDINALMYLGQLKEEEKDFDAAAAYYRFGFEKSHVSCGSLLGDLYQDHPKQLAVIYHTALATRYVDETTDMRLINARQPLHALEQVLLSGEGITHYRTDVGSPEYLKALGDALKVKILKSFNQAFRDHPKEMMMLLNEFDSLERVKNLLESDVLKQVQAALPGSEAKLFGQAAVAGAAAAAGPAPASASSSAGATPAATTTPSLRKTKDES